MPWHIEDDNSDCSGYAVVQDDNDRVMGCHDTLGEAEDQLAALYASESDKEKQMTRLNKTYEVTSFKALPGGDEGAGRFEAIVSVFGNVDFQGDRVVPGAFKGSIDRWREKGDPIPVIWSHDWANPHAHIGYVDPSEVEEVAESKASKTQGLKVAGRLDLDNPFAAQVYRLLKERRVKEFSFAYDVIREKEGRDRANELQELEIIEVGPTLKGANPSTELLGVKSQLEEAAKEAFDAGFDATNAAKERVLEKARTSMGARKYDDPEIDEEWEDLLTAAAGAKSEDAEQDEAQEELGDPEAAIEASIEGKSVGTVTVDIVPVLDKDALKAVVSELERVTEGAVAAIEALKKAVEDGNGEAVEDPADEVVTDPTDSDTEGEPAPPMNDSPEPITDEGTSAKDPKDDPDAELKARLADLEATANL